ncbi:hypothetical protein SISNIDRAFT_491229 [Sistotremastrum niveocremeum HHB9708]|uniref:Replication factor A protein 3 n=2 Tax=Sistotremastraceae TaxID=3402574 RepID=A0A164N1W5_9AGAM|nr:hypothetical protein SISNIDRAFT_491229 [Sistotremastrum niveocremeum HHB9708]KZT37478.1 hypothetical protein SISSUDRAFT_1062826 [Sistotremastrum suecicum HHB10207 ss-3]
MAQIEDVRINGKMMGEYVGKIARMVGKVNRVVDRSAVFTTSDGMTISVTLLPDAKITDTIVEFVGQVVNDTTLKMLAVYNMGDDEDLLSVVDQTVELIHKPQFSNMFY